MDDRPLASSFLLRLLVLLFAASFLMQGCGSSDDGPPPADPAPASPAQPIPEPRPLDLEPDDEPESVVAPSPPPTVPEPERRIHVYVVPTPSVAVGTVIADFNRFERPFLEPDPQSAEAGEDSPRFPRIVVEIRSAQQIASLLAAAHPIDIILIDDPSKLEAAFAADRIRRDQLQPMVSSELVFAAHQSRPGVIPDNAAQFAELLENGIAIADPEHDPVGRAAREQLRRMRWWDALSGRVLSTGNSAAALFALASEQADFAVVTEADVRSSDDFLIAKRIEARPGALPVWSIGLTESASPEAGVIADYLRSQRGLEIFSAFGFEPADR